MTDTAPGTNSDSAGASAPELASTIVASARAAIPASIFCGLVELHIIPVLDNLPPDDAAAMCHAFKDALLVEKQRKAFVRRVGYAKHEESLQGSLHALQVHCRREWKNGYEEQGEMMKEICSEFKKWFPVLLYVGIEKGAEFALVNKSLNLIESIYSGVWKCESR